MNQMASSTAVASTAFLLSLNLIFFTMVGATTYVPSAPAYCPKDALKFGVCADLLNLVKVEVGSVPTHPCCTLIQGLTDFEAAACLCTAIKANVLNIINLKVPVDLSVVFNNCGKHNSGFQCA